MNSRPVIIRTVRLIVLTALSAFFFQGIAQFSLAQGEGSGQSAETSSPAERIILRQSQLADKFSRLEELLLRRAEVAAAQDPNQAELLRQAMTKSQQQDVTGRLEKIVKLLQQDQVRTLGEALSEQDQAQTDMKVMLELLLSEDRSRRIESEKKRLRERLKQINKMIRTQRALQADTEAGSPSERTTKQQGKLADQAGKLARRITQEEQENKSGVERESDSEKESSTEKPGEPQQPSESEGKTPQNGDAPDAENPSDGSPQGKPQGEQTPGKPSKGQPSQSKPTPGKPSDGQPGESQPGESDSSPAPDQEEMSPQQMIEQAEKAMRRAEQELKDAQQQQATEEQERAIQELQKAKAQLERILRQLREEELKRTLTRLESRVRKMLQMQTEVYETSKRLGQIPEESRSREVEVEAGKLSRRESDIVLEATRTLTLLREEGSAVAFPEAMRQTRDDMQEVAQLLAEVNLDKITLAIEEDILASLEEMIVALQKAQREAEKRRKSAPSRGNQPGDPQDQPLVQQVEELKMIRALQMRVNRRTAIYIEMAPDETKVDTDLLLKLDKLSLRQQRIYETTRKIVLKKSQN